MPTGRTVPQALREALRLRMADYETNDDGFALNDDIWRFSGHVNPHTDDQTSDMAVVGFVFDADGHKLVHGDQALELRIGDLYVLDPLERHGVLAPHHLSTLTLFIKPVRIEELRRLDPAGFADRALDEADRLLHQPLPRNEGL
jgi:hypothetical protein